MLNVALGRGLIYADDPCQRTKRQIACAIPHCRPFKTRNLIKRRGASNAVIVKLGRMAEFRPGSSKTGRVRAINKINRNHSIESRGHNCTNYASNVCNEQLVLRQA